MYVYIIYSKYLQGKASREKHNISQILKSISLFNQKVCNNLKNTTNWSKLFLIIRVLKRLRHCPLTIYNISYPRPGVGGDIG